MTGSDTIYALSSGAGRSAIALLRLSGGHVAKVLESISGSLPPPRQFSLRDISDPASGERLDRAVVVWLPAPRSFTGEDAAELHLHGSPAVVAAVLGVLGGMPGLRPAEPGEFTLRAFLNGKMDLVEVEGLGDLLEARTAGQRRQAMRQMSGFASAVFDSWREQLLLIRADIEAVVDFVDEPGVAETASKSIDRRITVLWDEIDRAIKGADTAEVVRDGVKVVLAGFPNTGKSSLLNALARRDAAIVSDIPGTTRDVIEVTLDLGGIPVILTDTAGLRKESADKVEEEGIRRSRRHMSEADVLIWIWSPDVEGSTVVDSGMAPHLVVRNKADLEESGLNRNESTPLGISTRTGQGIPELISVLREHVSARFGNAESTLLVSARQKSAAERAVIHLEEALRYDLDRLELKAEAVRCASDEIGRLVGRVDVEEWLGAIFSRFCIGK